MSDITPSKDGDLVEQTLVPASSAGIAFYHLTTTPLEHALPKLLEKAVAGGYRTCLVAASQERVEQLNQWLWTYDPASFLPHGAASDGKAEQQPIWLATDVEQVNNPNMLMVTDGRTLEGAIAFERVLDVFDGRDPEATAAARLRWTSYKNAGYTLSYFRQTEQGSWQKKA